MWNRRESLIYKTATIRPAGHETVDIALLNKIGEEYGTSEVHVEGEIDYADSGCWGEEASPYAAVVVEVRQVQRWPISCDPEYKNGAWQSRGIHEFEKGKCTKCKTERQGANNGTLR